MKFPHVCCTCMYRTVVSKMQSVLWTWFFMPGSKPSAWSRILFEKHMVARVFKKCSFMEPVGSLPCSQVLAYDSYCGPLEPTHPVFQVCSHPCEARFKTAPAVCLFPSLSASSSNLRTAKRIFMKFGTGECYQNLSPLSGLSRTTLTSAL
jgi:hypothetical protein